MILINVKFRVKPEHADTFLADIDWFTTATRAEPGNLFFDWYQSPADPGEFLLVEGFHDELPGYLVETPEIINTLIAEKTVWDRMAEFQVKN